MANGNFGFLNGSSQRPGSYGNGSLGNGMPMTSRTEGREMMTDRPLVDNYMNDMNESELQRVQDSDAKTLNQITSLQNIIKGMKNRIEVCESEI